MYIYSYLHIYLYIHRFIAYVYTRYDIIYNRELSLNCMRGEIVCHKTHFFLKRW